MAGPQQAPGPASVLRGHRADVQCVTFLPGNRLIASGDAEGEVRIWDVEDLRTLHTQRLHDTNAGILQLETAYLPELSLISQGRDGVVKCWRLQEGGALSREPMYVFETGAFSFCRFSLLQRCSSAQHAAPGSKVQQGFATGPSSSQRAANQQQCNNTEGQQSSVQQVQHGLLYQQLHEGSTGPATAAQASAPEQTSKCTTGEPSCSNPMTAAVADDLDEEVEEQLMLRCGTGAAASTSGSSTAAATAATATGKGGAATRMGSGDRAASSSTAATVGTAANDSISSGPLDTDTVGTRGNGPLGPAPVAAAGGATESQHQGPLLAMAGADPADIGVWELGSSGAREVCVLSQRQQKKHGLCMALQLFQVGTSASPFHVLAGYEDGTIALWNGQQPQQYVTARQLHSESVMALALSPDCRSGASGAADEQLVLFKLNPAQGRLEVTQKLPLTSSGIGDVAIRDDGRIAAVAGWDGKVRLYHCKRKEPLAVLRYHQGAVACVRFAPGSHVFVSGGRDGLLALWNVYKPATSASDVCT